MPNHKTPPIIHTVQNLQLPKYELWTLDNGMPVYNINMGTQEVVRLEVVFNAGRPYEKQPLVARTTAAMLREGSSQMSGKIIAETHDFYGANLRIPFQVDTSNLVLYSLNKYFDRVLPQLTELLIDPGFPEKELRGYTQRKQQGIKEDLTKVDVVAYRQITECFFGKEHPYGYNSYPEMYDDIQREQLLQHHKNYYVANNGFIILSGKVDKRTQRLVNQYLGHIPKGKVVEKPALIATKRQAEKLHVKHDNALQSAMRIGRRLFPRNHPDAHGVYVLANILGGYFGSRLMKNIREDKGYSYNVSASFDTMRFDGSFQIDTEVSHDVAKDALQEIYHEINVLQQELVSQEELSMVRNYLMGSFLTMIDGPFHWGETLRTFLAEGLPPETLKEMANKVLTITPSEIQQLAQKYLQEDALWEVVVGA